MILNYHIMQTGKTRIPSNLYTIKLSFFKVYEWMKYGKTAKTRDTPLLKDQICLFNDVSKYVVAMILNRESAADRALSVSKFMSMSQVPIF